MEQPQPTPLATEPIFETVVVPPRAAPPQVSVGSLVGHAFAVWKANAASFATFAVLFGALNVAVMWGLGSPFIATGSSAFATPTPEMTAFMFSWRYATMIVAILLATLVQMSGLTAGAVQHLEGRRPTLGSMLAEGLRRSGVVFVAGLLGTLAVYGGLVLLVVPGVILAMAFSLAMPAVFAERLGPIAALGRSRRLTKGHRWKLFAVFVILYVVAMAPTFILQTAAAGAPWVGVILSMGVGAVTGSLFAVAPAVAFHDLRAAKEGAGTAELARVFE